MLSILVLGATGYIGGALVSRMKQDIPELQITALVRNAEHAKALEEIGITVELGDADDLGKVVDLVSKADVTINAALSGSIPLAQAILTGQRIHSDTGRRSVLLHLSRTAHSLHHEEPRFLQLQTTVYDDENLEWLAMLVDENSNSALVDRQIVEGSQSCPIFAFIIAPTTVFGNVQRSIPRLSHGLLDLVNCAITERYVVFPGGGGNAGNGIHLQSLVSLLMDVFQLAISSAPWPPEHTQFLFASGCAFFWNQVAEIVGRVLHSRGLLNSAQIYSCSPNLYPQLKKYTNSYAVEPLKAQTLGLRWSPNREQQIDSELEQEVEGLLAEVIDIEREG